MPRLLFEGGELRSKGGGKKSIHFNGSHENIELLLRTVISAQYLEKNSRFMRRSTRRYQGSGKHAAPDHLEKMEILSDLSIAENSTNAQ